MNTAPSPPPRFDPWTNGTPAYRRTLVTGMVCTFGGVVLLVIAALSGGSAGGTVRTFGLLLVGAGILSHLISILLRRRQAKEIIQAHRDRQQTQRAEGTGANRSKKKGS
ncbi:hypothetical protein ACFP47_04180 [Nesterenkonia lacusekhoensis]|uniref:Multidrug efflux pump subunit AcrB n=1 Tax=Nesterenkonia lacusekhoensis TaxID=150832 RepID=A0ABS4SY53_9MICC|nr:hypothetical protein [Nesterenkonia lacusekhoensis]MBP2317130.1 multidrug efflux pump subunit AcrB [Nesterenkonia lacusekhoensis]